MDVIKKAKNHIYTATAAILSAVMYAPFTTYAAFTPQGSIKEGYDAVGGSVDAAINDTTGYVAGIIATIIRIFGIICIIIGMFRFGMAMKDERPDEKSKAIVHMMVGVILAGIIQVLQTVGLIN